MKSVEVEQLRAALQRQREHNKLLETTLRAERDHRKACQADRLVLLRKLQVLLRWVEFGPSKPKEEILKDVDPGRLISSGVLL